MERRYETIAIVDPDAGDEGCKAVVARSRELVGSGGGRVEVVEEWGRRTLAYPIRKKKEGYYFYICYSGGAATVKDLERSLKLDETVLRLQTVRLEKGEGPQPPKEQEEGEAAQAAGAETGTDTGGEAGGGTPAREQAGEESGTAGEEAAAGDEGGER
ncbi:MAG TPA: 30S ribosomal protein S6 [Deltaproteobacteria bacterium]|nr:30S ribosomal protein S6 [Deltaproteobacteria bacterium]